MRLGELMSLQPTLITRKIENILIQANELSLPGKKKLIQEDSHLETLLIDVSETPIERPKKNKKSMTAARKKGILESPSNH